MNVAKVLFFILFLLGRDVVVAQSNITVCSSQGNDTCLASGPRVCLNTNGVEDCGNCANGYLPNEDDTICQLIDDFNLTFVLEIIDEYAPQFTTNATLEDRLLRLEIVLRVISWFRSRIPPVPFELDVNKFSLDTEEEEEQRHGYRYVDGLDKELPRFEPRRRLETWEIPPKLDWVEKGALTDVKDQGRCGCCWAVATMAAVESAAFLTKDSGFLQSLSFQQLISCDKENFGCLGGNNILAMSYTWENDIGGVATLNDYPYTDAGGETTETCKLDKKNISTAAVALRDPQVVLTVNDNKGKEERIEHMKAATTLQPVAMVIRSECGLLSSYKSGILTEDGDCACEDVNCLDHSVVVVGFDDTADIPFFKVRNSWGTNWGENGYFRIAQEGGGKWGLFGMLAEAVIPLDAYNSTSAVPDTSDGDDYDPEPWEIAVIAVAGAIVLCCLCGILTWLCRRCGKN